ncbi:hypothetical protein [Aquabacterium sp. A08]|uniref:hypothetical protein n=1 Tax=Aquabacterium sp. A08 TaxID=2718532 RepID=UPI001420D4D8|nr:hypothetical protein [Aquabacterium sp. A08]NIC43521.1 hypothetical protein [Aquabacterium sp. A08]
MYLVILAWLYVAVLMALAEAMSHNGTLLGAIVTFFLYGLMPIALVVYLMGTPLRRKARARQEAAAQVTTGALPAGLETTPSVTPDAGGEAPGAAEAGGVAPVGKQP